MFSTTLLVIYFQMPYGIYQVFAKSHPAFLPFTPKLLSALELTKQVADMYLHSVRPIQMRVIHVQIKGAV